MKKAIANMLIEMAGFYGYELEERQLQKYVEVLCQFPGEVVLKAGQAYLRNPKNEKFPIPPHKMLSHLLPQELEAKDLARVTALRVREAVTKFGWSNSSKAKEHIGPTGWKIVERFGGWLHICENLGVNIQEGTFLAQARDALESEITLQRSGVNTSQPAIEQSKPNPQLEAVVKQLAQARSMEEK